MENGGKGNKNIVHARVRSGTTRIEGGVRRLGEGLITCPLKIVSDNATREIFEDTAQLLDKLLMISYRYVIKKKLMQFIHDLPLLRV